VCTRRGVTASAFFSSKKYNMKYLSLCSGIEAATVAWHPLGWEAVAYSEIERFPSEVLAHHYPSTPNLGDMTKFKEWTNVSDVDLLVGGTPCQSFSVAGLRKGLDDPRGNLMLTYLAIAKQYRPNWLVWENVPGVLSSNGGRDFGSFLGGLAECGYGFAYRVLDAQFFGVAQRRRRVFVVGYLGDWRAAAAVLFERHSLQGHPAPSREKRQAVAASVEAGVDVSKCLTARGAGGQNHDPETSNLLPISFSGCDDGMDTQINVTPTMRVAGNSQGNLAVAVGTDLYNGNITGDVAATMGTPGSSSNASGPTVMQSMAVRRLTPVECERLQGFSDNYTDIKSKNKPTPDGPRYKALGNSMAVPVMAWIGQRIEQVEAICKQNK
jgi:DNA (cytosine-5)-methyltransferase 1